MTIQLVRPDDPRAPASIVLSTGSEDERRSLRRGFERKHCVLLRSFLSGPLLAQIQAEVDEGEFYVLETGISTELCMRATGVSALLDLLTNDPELFELVQAITGCDRIGAFIGRVYRLLPEPAYEGDWHDDVHEGRMIAMSINLTPRPYRGGVLEIREHDSRGTLHQAKHGGPGDALLFRVDDRLQHRVSSVEGTTPRTAYAGWFISAENLDYLNLINFPGRRRWPAVELRPAFQSEDAAGGTNDSIAPGGSNLPA
jgi:2-oxoglutarate-Fe(II)-dependent oxygenase superfamily protein